MRRRAASRPRVRGMTLLELLVALSIMAISLALIYRAVGGSARGVSKLEQNQGVALLADSLMDAFPMVDPGGTQASGQDGVYAWQVASAPFSVGGLPETAVPLHALRITISVENRSWIFETLRPQRPLQQGEVTR
ncbi:type II secretion system protein [Delftia acidovorans]|uniref:General secretion pathway protein GspI n=1 Tax=Chryseobacterium sp. B5 TaxID=2050562 RepID=A0A2G7T998_9FLAO|nr:type II secretion system protein [Delftia acidovorans]QPR37063.1 type II secretion system protein [Delftia acidovorans]HBJ99933.1 type II secretion system protein [Delftia acidovorans]